MAEESIQERPFVPNQSCRVHSDVENPAKFPPASPPADEHRRKLFKKGFVLCCGCCSAVVAIAAVILLVLALTLYRVRQPQMALNAVTILSKAGSGGGGGPLALLNATAVLDVSVKNPNAVAYHYYESTTSFYYRSSLVGVARGPAGTAAARRTVRMNLTVDVGAGAGGAVDVAALAGALAADEVPIDSSTAVGGHVKVLGLVRHHVDVTMNCTVTVAVSNWTILDQSCRQRVKV